jgi:hypothetical protein
MELTRFIPALLSPWLRQTVGSTQPSQERLNSLAILRKLSLGVNTFLLVRGKRPGMALRCELFGHDFGESTIEESYSEEERGTVLTVREYKSCKRCEHIHNISENEGLVSTTEESKTKDEQSAEAENRVEKKRQAGLREDVKEETEAIDTVQAVEETEPTDTPESTVTAPDKVEESSSEASDESSAGTSSVPLDKADDAVILSEPETQESDDDNFTPLNSDGAVIIEDGTDTADPSTEPSEELGTGSGRDDSSHTADDSENSTSDAVPTYQCPRCRFELPVSESSFFAGDVCPECRVGYLEDTSDTGL